MVGDFCCPVMSPRSAIPCHAAGSGIRTTPGTHVDACVDGRFDFEPMCPGSPFSVKRAAKDPTLVRPLCSCRARVPVTVTRPTPLTSGRALAAPHASGGIVVAWARDVWPVSRTDCRQFSVTITLQQFGTTMMVWLLAAVYGPVLDALKPDFLAEQDDP